MKNFRSRKIKKKSYGGYIFLGILVISVILIFSYFKFIYESPQSLQLREDIVKILQDYQDTLEKWAGNPVAENELKKLQEIAKFLTSYKDSKMDNETLDKVRKKFAEFQSKFEKLKIDLPKTKEIPKSLTKLEEELDIYRDAIAKPSKKEKEVLHNAYEDLEKLKQDLENSKTIKDLESIFMKIQNIKSNLVIFHTMLQLKQAEWNEQKSIIKQELSDFEAQEEKLTSKPFNCYTKLENIVNEIRSNVERGIQISKQEFNIENLNLLKKINQRIDYLYSKLKITIKHINDTGENPDKPCGQEPPPEDPPCKPKYPPEIIKTFYPEVNKSKIPGGENYTQVIINVTIDKDGAPINPTIATSSGSKELDNLALDAILRFEFTPAKCEDGTPIEFQSKVPVKINGK